MSELPYFKWYPKDAETDENFRAMTDAEVGFYLRCLNHSWLNHGLPADAKERARALGKSKRYCEKQWVRVGQCFELDLDPHGRRRVVNPRQESERKKAKEKSESASKAVRTRYERRTNAPPRALTRPGSGSVSDSSSEPEGGGLEGGGDFADWIEPIRGRHPNPSQFNVGLQQLTERSDCDSPAFRTEFSLVHDRWSKHWKQNENGRYAPKFADFVLNWESYRKGPPTRSQQTAFEKLQRASGGEV